MLPQLVSLARPNFGVRFLRTKAVTDKKERHLLNVSLKALPTPRHEPPKRPANAYSLFVKDNFAKFKHGTAVETMKTLGKEWQKASKKTYEEKAAKLKHDYDAALKKYHNQLTANDVAIQQARNKLLAQLGRKTKRTERFPGAPKRPLTGYMLFVQDMRGASAERQRQVFGKSLKDLDAKEFVKTVAAKWKSGSSDLKKPYNDRYAVSKKEYDTQKAKFNAEINPSIKKVKDTVKQARKSAMPKRRRKRVAAKKTVRKTKKRTARKTAKKPAKKTVRKTAKKATPKRITAKK